MSQYELYLNDILRTIKLIENSIKNKEFKEFEKNADLIDSNSMRLQIIGESINRLPDNIKKRHKEVSWKKLIQTRNIISHAYFAINKIILWDVIKKEVPKLKKVVLKIKQELKKNSLKK